VIQITPQMRILVAIEPVDGRKGIDSLARLCQDKLQADPFSGCLFVFRSRRGTSIRILVYDGQGFWLAQKRLSQGRFVWWPSGKEPSRVLQAHQAQLLLAAANPEIEAAPVWRKVSWVLVNPKSHVECRSGAPRFAGFWPDPFHEKQVSSRCNRTPLQ
jgi:transposase